MGVLLKLHRKPASVSAASRQIESINVSQLLTECNEANAKLARYIIKLEMALGECVDAWSLDGVGGESSATRYQRAVTRALQVLESRPKVPRKGKK